MAMLNNQRVYIYIYIDDIAKNMIYVSYVI